MCCSSWWYFYRWLGELVTLLPVWQLSAEVWESRVQSRKQSLFRRLTSSQHHPLPTLLSTECYLSLPKRSTHFVACFHWYNCISPVGSILSNLYIGVDHKQCSAKICNFYNKTKETTVHMYISLDEFRLVVPPFIPSRTRALSAFQLRKFPVSLTSSVKSCIHFCNMIWRFLVLNVQMYEVFNHCSF